MTSGNAGKLLMDNGERLKTRTVSHPGLHNRNHERRNRFQASKLIGGARSAKHA
jgi:hypothetical protein